MAESETLKKPICYVGLGASAGGLEALDTFFEAMPPDSGMAFVVIQHLSPNYKSLMAELVSKHTRMTVLPAAEGMVVKADTVYIIPPRKDLRLSGGKLQLSEQERNERGINLPIDLFFSSLAEDQKEKAVGIILSGTGSDGTRGIRSIKEAGGMVLAQDGESARFDGMPNSARATGFCDFVLPVVEMPLQLMGFARHPSLRNDSHSSSILLEEDLLSRVFTLLQENTQVDFSLYKMTTVTRRIERRMTVNQINDLREYVLLMEDRGSEVQALYRELLIGVTSFFRDIEVWETLMEKHLSKLFIEKEGQEMRMWVAGCSTGEEAYTLAIVCADLMERLGESRAVKIFATDVDREAVNRAGQGLYPESVAADLTPRLLSKYFHHQGDYYQISRGIREMVVFAQHSLITDPPFTNLDLVSCRNLLIYLQPILQQKVMDRFRFALGEGGLLMLGTSETTGADSQLFELLDAKAKIYRSKGRSPWSVSREFRSLGAGFESGDSIRRLYPRNRVDREEEQLLSRLLQTLAQDDVPVMVVVNDQMEVIHIVGDTQGILQLPPGPLKNNVTRMVPDDLAIPLATGLRRTFESKEPLQYRDISFRRHGQATRVNLRFRYLVGRKDQEALVVFFVADADSNDQTAEGDEKIFDVSQATQQRIKDLEQELRFTRENLQATIEELETSNEELQATNEELLASNEELQSTNEELQSVNEELYTVNSELQYKIVELTELGDDFDTMLSSSKIYTLFLDSDLYVRKYTPYIDAIFPILPSDIGRSFAHLRHHLQNLDPIHVVQEVMRTGEKQSLEVRTTDNVWYRMHVAPDPGANKEKGGIVMTLVDISTLMFTRQKLVASQENFHCLFETLEDGLLYLDATGRIKEANKSGVKLLEIPRDDLIGMVMNEEMWTWYGPDEKPVPKEQRPLQKVLDTGQAVHRDTLGIRNDAGRMKWFDVCVVPILGLGPREILEVYMRFRAVDAPVPEHRIE